MPAGKKTLQIGLTLILAAVTLGLLGCEGKKESNPGQESELGQSSAGQLKESPQEGFLAPGFTVPDLTGSLVSLSQYRGKVVLLNIWATWCGPCRREIPSLERLYQLRKGKDFEIVAVSVDRTSPSKVADFVARLQMSFQVLHDSRGEVGRRYWARAIPSSFLLDKRGVIRWKVAGAREWDDDLTLGKIDRLLSE